jgi:hypothetical protein
MQLKAKCPLKKRTAASLLLECLSDPGVGIRRPSCTAEQTLAGEPRTTVIGESRPLPRVLSH